MKLTLRKAAAGLATGAVLGLGAAISAAPAEAAPVSPAAVSVNCFARPIYSSSGPGLKNWHAYDPNCNWAGKPGTWTGDWRLTKKSAQKDADTYNARFN